MGWKLDCQEQEGLSSPLCETRDLRALDVRSHARLDVQVRKMVESRTVNWEVRIYHRARCIQHSLSYQRVLGLSETNTRLGRSHDLVPSGLRPDEALPGWPRACSRLCQPASCPISSDKGYKGGSSRSALGGVLVLSPKVCTERQIEQGRRLHQHPPPIDASQATSIVFLRSGTYPPIAAPRERSRRKDFTWHAAGIAARRIGHSGSMLTTGVERLAIGMCSRQRSRDITIGGS